MNLVRILYNDNVHILEEKIVEFSTCHNVLNVSVHSRPSESLEYAAIIVYDK